MATIEEIDVSRQRFSVAYVGMSRSDDHSMDVQALAPALLGFGRLLREGNSAFNGKRATAKVFVVSDFEHKCFNINFELIVSLIDQLKDLLGLDDVKTAKEVLEWLGLIGIGPGILGGGALSYFSFLKWKNGRKTIEDYTETASSGVVKVTIEGNNNTVLVHPDVLSLSKNPKALRATKDTLLPLGQNGFDTIRVTNGHTETGTITDNDVGAIVASCNEGIESSREEISPDVEITSAWLSVYSPVYDAKAEKWRFRLGRDVIYADITETRIAEEALARGGALSDDSYQVRLEITTPFDAQGNPKPHTYRIIEVLRFVPSNPLVQKSLFDQNRDEADSD